MTPVIGRDTHRLYLIEPTFARRRRLGGSVLAQCFGALGDDPADVDDATALKNLIDVAGQLIDDRLINAYHDRSDGGLIATLVEMAFAGRSKGLDIHVGDDALAELFAEEVGIVVGLADANVARVRDLAANAGLEFSLAATPRDDQNIVVRRADAELFGSTRADLERTWASTSHAMQRLRDDAACADEEFDAIADAEDAGLIYRAGYDPAEDVAAPFIATGVRPRVAILREQGVNGQLEMAAAFHRVGFEAVDVHMSDLFNRPDSLGGFQALAACGGFSYGDVLGGGGGWAKSILFEERVRDAFAAFFARDTLALGICNGCQMMAELKELIPGAARWPRFVGNRSERFEARTVEVRVNAVASPWLTGMAGALLPIPVAHGEGRAEFDMGVSAHDLERHGQLAVQYVNRTGMPTGRYPLNPNGSEQGLAGVTAASGPRSGHDASSGTRVPGGPELLGGFVLGRRRPLAAVVQECARGARLNSVAGLCPTQWQGQLTRGRMIYTLEERSLETEGDYFIADTAVVIGAVRLKHEASIWWGAVLRGDYDSITVGARTNIQDNSVVHMDEGYPVTLGEGVTVGHKAVLHGCTVGDNSLIGINAVILNDVIIGNDCLIGSNALLTEGKVIPDRSLVLGSPGKIVRELTDEQVEEITEFSDRYVNNFRRYQEAFQARADGP